MLVGVIIAKLLVLSEIVLGDNIKMKKFLLVIDLDGSNIPSNSKLLYYIASGWYLKLITIRLMFFIRTCEWILHLFWYFC